ncbi:MAG: amidohydrolase [Tenuifilaceae bacterium]|jgi:predicted amidohydrolase|nr:amidohydrolase [Tenuifilaceae bacterium]
MKVENLRVAIVQANLIWENIGENINQLNELLNKVEGDTHLVILPEMFTTGFSMNAEKLAEPDNGTTLRWMIDISSAKGFALCGSFIVKEKNKFFNRLHFVTPQGKVYRYDKRHLFTFANENTKYTPGLSRLVLDYLGWRILPQICYDVRFPVWSRNRGDYDLVINVANFPGQRREIWNTLLKARAIENQCYVAAANRVGSDGIGIYYTGDSQLIDPVGQTISSILPGEEGVVQGSFSRDELDEFRRNFPVLNDADDFVLNQNK